MYKPKHFDIQEFVPRQAFEVRGEKSIQLIDEDVLITADQLREAYGPMIINNWHFVTRPAWAPDVRNWSGLRMKGCPHGTAFSQHRFGRAADCIFRDYTAEQVRQDVLNHPDLFPRINAVELGVSWFHFDVRPGVDRILTFTA